MRQVGQRTIPASFLSKSRVFKQDTEAKRSPISLSEFLNRKLRKTGGRLLQEKKGSVCSLGLDNKYSSGRGNEAGRSLTPNGAIFQQFSRSVMGKHEVDASNGAEVLDAGDVELGDFESEESSRKRKESSGDTSGDNGSKKKYLVVLGDDPKPRLSRREQSSENNSPQPTYNYYANGQGWWDGDKEGIGDDEIGHNEIWEGLCSTTLGGLDWH